MFRRKPKQWIYLPLTEQDYAIQEDVRYRVGHWLAEDYDTFTVLAAFAAVVLPPALAYDWLTGGSGGSPLAVTTGVVIWLIGTSLAYARWFAHRQAASERRRGYRFYVPHIEYDTEVAQAKETLLSMTSSEREREQALELLLSRGACSLPGQPAPQLRPR